jgi:anti-sigma factor RsiW
MTPLDRELMAYHDGELSPRERARVAARLAADRSARQRLEELSTLRGLVRSWARSKRDRFDVSDAVMREVRAPRVVRARWVSAAIAASLAAAAALALSVARTRAEPELNSVSSPSATVPSSGEALGPPEEVTGARVESVDLGGRSGSIFVLGSSAGTTTVIWMNDLPENRRRIEPL